MGSPLAIRLAPLAGLVIAGALSSACASAGGASGPAALVHPALDRATHPLDPLTAAEVVEAVRILRDAGVAGPDARFAEIAAEEPPKAEVLAWTPDAPFRRTARVVVLDRAAGRSSEVLVDLRAGAVLRDDEIRGRQPLILVEEYDLAGAAVRADPRFIEAMTHRGIDPAAVYVDVWAPGEKEAPGGFEGRIARAIFFHRGDDRSPYGPPVEGVVATIDMRNWTILEVLDTGAVPVPDTATDFYDPAVTGPERPRLRPLVTSTPEGPGFDLEGNRVDWDRWTFRWSMHPREGLVIHGLGWRDGEEVRTVLYRASHAEMLVPYADPSEAWSWRSAFDGGEYGLGRMANPQARGANVPGHAVMLDAVIPDDAGVPQVVPGAVAIWERDAGFLFTHFDAIHGVAARPSRELVIGFLCTIGNYDYACRWVLTQDGAISYELVLTGSLLTKAVNSASCEVCGDAGGAGPQEPKGEQRFGTLVAPGVLAPNHQHFVCLRLDFDVDGTANAVREVEVKAEPAGPANPRGNGFLAVPTWLRSEKAARREAAPESHRVWEVVNTGSRRAFGHPAGYTLIPGETAPPYLQPGTGLRHLGAFIEHAFHATRFREGELAAAGNFPNQNRTPDGLARWCEDDESLAGADVVAWYTLGVTHVPRPEEYPIMNATKVGFRLVPTGFFPRNPGLSVPAAEEGR